jgi:hypothetical protein
MPVAGSEHTYTNVGFTTVRLLYGWTGQETGSGFINLAPSILHYDWF